jgi:hypothetical protein
MLIQGLDLQATYASNPQSCYSEWVDYSAPITRRYRHTSYRTTLSGVDIAIVTEHTRTLASPLSRFMAKVDTDGPNGCWIWKGYVGKDGYGRWRMPEESHSGGAHRAAYRMMVGPIPEGRHLDHLCRNPSCVNPKHLEPVTPQVNVDRGLRGQWTECGKGHPFSGENLGKRKDGRRYCKTCSRESMARYWAKLKKA